MNQGEFRNYMFSKYPVLMDLFINDPRYFYNFSCPSGWQTGLDQACQTIMDFVKANEQVIKVKPSFAQVKEKFGTARLYINAPEFVDGTDDKQCTDLNNKFWDMVRKLEDEMSKTCQNCGQAPATACTVKGWIVTVCKTCQEQRPDYYEVFTEDDN